MLETGISVVGGFLGIFTILVVAFYWIVGHKAIRQSLLQGLPNGQRSRGEHIWDDVEVTLGAWVRGQLLLMLAIGATFLLGLSALGVKYAVLLAVVAACAELLPIIGPWVGTTPAVLIALTQGVPMALLVLAFGIVVQLVETNVLLPRVLGHAVGVSPLLVFLSILVGAELLGLLGALLAVPVVAAMAVVLQDLRAPAGDLHEIERPRGPERQAA